MNQGVGVAGNYVHDQDDALSFYVNKLGFTVHTDARNGDYRWLAVLFTLTVIANFAAMTRGQPPAWITYSPLPPLFLLMFSGLYMFALPYVANRKLKR